MSGILSIFMQLIHHLDSYIFLNAVQGLSTMGDGYGKHLPRGLVNTYAGGLESSLGATALSHHDVDRIAIQELVDPRHPRPTLWKLVHVTWRNPNPRPSIHAEPSLRRERPL